MRMLVCDWYASGLLSKMALIVGDFCFILGVLNLSYESEENLP